MPIRLLRPGLTTSRRFNALDWQAQSFYVRLLTLVDDYGRCEADPTLLASLCFPLHRDINCQQVADICQQLSAQGMAVFYEVSGTAYLQLTRWKDRARTESRFPAPPDNICQQLPANVVNCGQMITSPPSPSPSPSPAPCRAHMTAEVEIQEEESKSEPQIPCPEDFVREFMNDGIPREWLLVQWDWFENNRAWLTPQGQLKRWERIVRTRWSQDRATWKPREANGQPPMADSPRERIEALEVTLKGEKNPEKRAALRRELAALEARKKPAAV